MDWIAVHKDAVTAIGSLIVAVVALSTFIWQVRNANITRTQETKNKDFEAYHRLIKDLVRPQEKAMFLDQQVACVFELRRFVDYREVSLRILDGLADSWKEIPNINLLRDEINLTRNYLRNTKRSK